MDDSSFLAEMCRSCPLIFPNGDPRCGLSVGPGWYGIVRELSLAIEAELAKMPPEFDRTTCIVEQVKEKFGTLRYYVCLGTPEIDELIERAQVKSETTCEFCGRPGRLRGKGWVKTLCDGCDEEREKRKREGL